METNQEPVQPQEEEKKEENPWGTLAFGILLIAGACFLYYTFDNLEKEGGSVRMNWILIMLYELGGKWTASIVVALLGGLMIYSGGNQIIKKRNNPV